MYLGKSVTMVKKPQSWPIWAQTRAQSGTDVNMPFQGMFLSLLDMLSVEKNALWSTQQKNPSKRWMRSDDELETLVGKKF